MLLTNIKTFIKFLSRQRLYTLVTILGFAVGLTFVTILGLYVKQELSVDAFHEKKDRIFLIAQQGSAHFPTRIGKYVSDLFPAVENYTRFYYEEKPLEIPGKDVVSTNVLYADSSFFNIFSFPLLEGDPSSVLTEKDMAVVSQSYAYKIFGNEPAVGKYLPLNGQQVLITGVMKDFPTNTQFKKADVVASFLHMSHIMWEGVLDTDNNSSFTAYFLAREGSDLPGIAPALLENMKKDLWIYGPDRADTVRFIPLQQVYYTMPASSGGYLDIKGNTLTLIAVYMAVAILILVIAILNYINMSVAQAGFRGKEAAMKKLVGGTRRDIFLQMMSESLLMTLLAFCLALGLSFLFEPFFNSVLSTDLALSTQFTPDFIVSVVVLLLATSFVAGLLPATVISRFKPVEILKGELNYKIKTSYSSVLVVVQYTVGIILLICSSFIMLQYNHMRDYDMGYDRENLFVIYNNGINEDQAKTVRNELLTYPDIEAVSISQGTPFENYSASHTVRFNEIPATIRNMYIDSAFLNVYGLTIEPTGIPVDDNTLFVNQKTFNGMEPDSTSFSATDEYGVSYNIGGIISDFKYTSLHSEQAWLWIRMSDNFWPTSFSIKIRAGAKPFEVAEKAKESYAKISGKMPYHAEFADDMVQKWYESEKKMSQIMGAFSILAILIMIMGVLAMSLYAVRQKEKEIGIRKVNGATVGQILAMLNRQIIPKVIIAFVIACPLAYYAMIRWLWQFPYRIEMWWWVFVAAGVAVLLFSLLCVTLQSMHTAKMNPVDTLKGE